MRRLLAREVVGYIIIGIALAATGTAVLAARDSSGTYSRPSGNPVVSGTPITSTWMNTLSADIATEITDSLSRSGKGGMLAPLRTTDGSVSVPSLSFTSETNSGWYRAGAGDLRFSLLGADRLRLGPAASAPFVFTSPQAAAGTATDFLFNTTATRTAGLLFDFQNNGASKFTLGTGGNVTVAGDATVVGTVGTPTIDRAGTIGIGITNGTTITIGRTGQAVSLAGEPQGAYVWRRVVATSDTTNSTSATATDIAGLTFSCASGKRYLVRGVLFVYSAAATTGLGVSAKATGAPTTSSEFFEVKHFSATATYDMLDQDSFADLPSVFPGTFANGVGLGYGQADNFDGQFVTTGTGTFQLVLVTEVNTSTVTVKAGSYLEWMEI